MSVASGLDVVEVVAPRENRLETPAGRLVERLPPPPGLHDRPRGKLRVQDLVPADHPPAVPCEYRGYAPVEICLQRSVVPQPVTVHERLDRPGDVDAPVREQIRHLAHETVEEREGLLARRIEDRIEDAEPPLDRVRPRRARKLRMTHEPARRMPGDIELGHDPDPTVAGEGDDAPDLVLRVVRPV